jgi:hypothetical protein
MIFLLGALAAGCGSERSADVSRPEAFARQVAVQPGGSGKLQRLTLPPALLTASKRRDLGDIRLFDARGRLVGMALLAGADEAATSTVDLPIYPVLGGSEGGLLQDSQLSVRVESDGAVRAVTVDRSNARDEFMPAALLDTRKLRQPVASIVLKATIPVERPVSFNLLTSTNLRDWEPLADKVLFRPSGDKPMLGGDQVELAGADLRGRFVGVSWAGPGEVALDGASAILTEPNKVTRSAVPTTPLKLADPHELILHLPDNGRLTGLRVTASANDGIVPVQLSAQGPGRDTWESFAKATIAPDRGATTIDLPPMLVASVKLEADRRTGGFSEAPRVELLFDPVELLVGLSGTPPYRLAVGQPAATPNFLTTNEIAPGMAASEFAKLQRAALASEGQIASPINVQSDPGNLQDRRKWLLWTALLVGTLVLLWIALQLVRTGSQDQSTRQEGRSA